MVLVLLPVTDEEPVLPPAALAALARLGVTSVSLLRDEESAGIVLEGWALDPARRRRRRACSPAGAREVSPVARLPAASPGACNMLHASGQGLDGMMTTNTSSTS